MAQSGYTPISLYYSTTAAAAPTAGNLVSGELAINITDGKLYYKDNSGVVQLLASKGATGPGGSTTQVQYNNAGAFAGSANMTFNGTSLTLANDATIHGLTVGTGNGAVATSVALGASALAAVNTGSGNVAIGSTALTSNTSGGSNTSVGWNTLAANTTGFGNVALGQGTLQTNISGNYNTGLGYQSLLVNTASNNTAVGTSSLTANTSGTSNVSVGYQSLFSNTTASNNTAVGYQAGYSTTTQGSNTFVGKAAGYNNTTGGYINAFGANAAFSNTTGGDLDAFGTNAAYSNTTGANNAAFGTSSLYSTTTGNSNTAVGHQSLYNNTTADNNTAVGYQAGYSGTTAFRNTLIGVQAGYSMNTTAASVCIGWQAGYSMTGGGSNTIIGDSAGYSITSNANTIVGQNAGNLLTTGGNNAFFGAGSGTNMTTGANNTIIGGFGGNQGGLDIRTLSNYIVLSDGAGNPRQIINNNGQVVINDVAFPAGATSTQFYVLNTTTDYIMFSASSNASPAGNFIKYSTAAPNNTANEFLTCADTSANRLLIRSNGGIANYQANNTNLSDEREKKDIELAGNYLDKICAIPVKTFLYNDQTDEDLNLGVIAQDVQAVAPELVSETNWGTKDEPKMRLSIYQTDLQYALMKALQELKAEFDAYKATHP